ncbi:MAG: D-amino acid dehydrogenase [Beijerinckiaceae bacterium]
MRVIVCGAGIIGVTTAYELARKGFETIVVDRCAGVARETSAGNAGVIAPGYVTPWAAPGMPRKVLRYLGKPAAPVIFRPRASVSQWRWIWRWLKNCSEAHYRINKGRSQRVAYYSRERLHHVRSELGIEYEASQGYLQLFRSGKDRELAAPALAILREAGIAHQLLEPDMCLAIEPGLMAREAPLHSGLFLPDDEAGDCALFAERLAARLQDEGVVFRLRTTIEGLASSDSGRIVGVAVRDEAGRGEFLEADAVVLAAGVESVALARPLGIDLPLYPVKGYSVTLRVSNEAFAPRAAMIDEAYKTAITRFGDRVRIAGTAELSDDALTPRATPCNTLLTVARDWFPQGIAIPMKPDFWIGRRPMTPDGPPLLGPTPVGGLFLNVGHGSSGWAMSLGSARAVADVVAGDAPDLDLDGLTLSRYGG